VRHLGKIRSIFLLIDFTNRWRCCDILCNWGRPGPIPRRRIPVQGEEVRGKKCTRGLSVCGGGYDPLWVDGGGRQKRLRRRRRRSQRVRATRSPLSSTVLGGPLVSYTTQNRRQTKLWNKHPSNEIQTIQFLNTEKWPVCSVCVHVCVCLFVQPGTRAALRNVWVSVKKKFTRENKNCLSTPPPSVCVCVWVR
jgi:hypothetical protein